MSLSSALQVLAISAGCSITAAAIGWLIIHLAKGRSLAFAVCTVSVAATGSILAASLGTAEAMFLSSHDLHVLLVMLIPAALVACIVAVGLGRRVAGSARELGISADALGTIDDLGSAKPVITRELGLLRDQLRHAQRRIADGREREKALENSRRELVGWVSHDLRTPLAGMRAMTEALEDGVVGDPETVARYLRRIREETDRLSGMVDDLFELSRVQAASLSLSLSTVTLGDLVSDALASVDSVAHAVHVQLRADPHEQATTLTVDVAGLGRVLSNLLINAIRHTPHDGVVRMLGGSDHDGAWLEVHDSCGGIAEPDLARVFDVGYRGSAARTPHHDSAVPASGAGLGLAIARAIVEAHEGDIQVRNAGGGCCFRVTLPQQRLAQPQRQAPVPTAVTPSAPVPTAPIPTAVTPSAATAVVHFASTPSPVD